MANRLAQQGVRTLVAYPEIDQAPKTLAGSSAIPVVLDTEQRTRSSRANMARFVRLENVKVVYLTDRPLWSVWYPSLRRAGVRKIIVHDHTSGERTVPKGVRRAFKRAVVRLPGVTADVVIAVSDYVAERDKAVTLIAPEKIRRVWNGVDEVIPGSENDRPDIRSLLGLGEDAVVIACACRATRDKGVGVLFKAFDRACDIAASSPVLAYVGAGPEFEELTALRSTLRSGGRIHMVGYQPSAATLLRTSDVCAVPSVWQDAFPLAVLEMMARGRAIVATRVGGVPEMIEDSVSGILVPPDDVESLARALATVLSSSDLRSNLGRAAQLRATQLFNAERQVSEMIDAFQEIFSG